MPHTHSQRIQYLQKSLEHIPPILTQLNDYELNVLLSVMHRSYNHILIETGLRHPISPSNVEINP